MKRETDKDEQIGLPDVHPTVSYSFQLPERDMYMYISNLVALITSYICVRKISLRIEYVFKTQCIPQSNVLPFVW